jgi:heavy metal sensor kinase
MMRSLRKNLMLGIGLTAVAIFICAGVAIYVLARAALLAEFDTATHAKARVVASNVEVKNGVIRVDEVNETHIPEFERTEKPEYFQVWTDDGRTLAKSARLGSADLQRAPAMGNNEPITEFVQLPDGRRGRQTTLRFVATLEEDEPPGKPQHAIVTLARDTGQLDHILARLGGVLILVSTLATAAMLALTALVIRRGLTPVDHLAHRITRLNARNLSARLAVETAPSELSPIVVGLNGLLERLENAFEREKSFTADAAHELRTPLAGLESALDVCSRRTRAPEAYATVVRECLDVVRGMHGMIDNLLLLARADGDQIPTTKSPVNLDDLLADAWRRFKQAAEQRNLTVHWDVESDLSVQTDPDRLRHVVVNLFDNAVRYADDGGRLSVSADRADGSIIVRIANTGSRVTAEDAAHVFERFWRGDPARTEIGIHCGLGLSVCRKMVAVLDGSIRARSEVDGEFVVEISLPATNLHPNLMAMV